jgi:hypothetical protein
MVSSGELGAGIRALSLGAGDARRHRISVATVT